MSMYTNDPGLGAGAHGRTSPLRLDPSTVLGLFVIGALVILAGLHFAFKGGVSVGLSR